MAQYNPDLGEERGMTILHFSMGDLKVSINDLDIATLIEPNGGQTVMDHIADVTSFRHGRVQSLARNAACLSACILTVGPSTSRGA